MLRMVPLTTFGETILNMEKMDIQNNPPYFLQQLKCLQVVLMQISNNVLSPYFSTLMSHLFLKGLLKLQLLFLVNQSFLKAADNMLSTFMSLLCSIRHKSPVFERSVEISINITPCQSQPSEPPNILKSNNKWHSWNTELCCVHILHVNINMMGKGIILDMDVLFRPPRLKGGLFLTWSIKLTHCFTFVTSTKNRNIN